MNWNVLIDEWSVLLLSFLLSYLGFLLLFGDAKLRDKLVWGGTVTGYLGKWLLDVKNFFPFYHPDWQPLIEWGKYMLVVSLYLFIFLEVYRHKQSQA